MRSYEKREQMFFLKLSQGGEKVTVKRHIISVPFLLTMTYLLVKPNPTAGLV
jgi:hypothetical protein